jgi:outer membrane protein W
MLRSSVMVSALVVLTAASAQAQRRFEVSVSGGGATSGGYDLGFVVADPETGDLYDGISFGSGVAYGTTIGYYLNEAYEIELGFHRQESNFTGQRVDGGEDEFMPVSVNHIQGYFIYNFSDDSHKVRPFAGIGLGATIFGSDDFRGREVESESYFSGSLTGGIKAVLRGSLGLRVQARFSPTYIGSTTEGYWCGWGACWPVEEAHYATQLGLTAGVNLRFGPAPE